MTSAEAIIALYERELNRVGITGLHKAAIKEVLELAARVREMEKEIEWTRERWLSAVARTLELEQPTLEAALRQIEVSKYVSQEMLRREITI